MARLFGKTDLKYLSDVLQSKRLGWREGGYVAKLDEAFAKFTGAKHGICRNSAMTALAQAVAVSGAGCVLSPCMTATSENSTLPSCKRQSSKNGDAGRSTCSRTRLKAFAVSKPIGATKTSRTSSRAFT